jgi:UDP-N-acetylglucosamine acyltransferase
MNVIHPNAIIGSGTTVGHFTTIENDVEIGENCWIGSNVSIMSGTRIGDHTRIFPGAIVGAVPQDLKFDGEASILEIGNHVTIREYCTINRGTKANYKTQIKDNCLLMAYVHIAHDCMIGERSILANNVNLAGHIEIGTNVVLGGLTAIHQFVKIGDHSMVGGGSLVRKDVPPFVKAAREPLCFVGINSVGLRRRGFSKDDVHHIQHIYRLLFQKGYNVTQALDVIESSISPSVFKDQVLAFIRNSDRGLMKGFRQLNVMNGSQITEPR